MSEKRWSIIIPALNEERCIGRCLDSICALQYNTSDLEVIVADNGSSDRTVAIAESHADRLDISVLAVPTVPVGAVRNAAVSRAVGQFLAFLDADCVVAPSWLGEATEVLTSNPSTIVGSAYALPPDAGWPAQVWHYRFHEGRSGRVPYLPGGNLLMEKSLFWKIGGFDQVLRSNEDSEFCFRASAAGVKILAFPQLAAVHLGAERDLLHFAKRQLWHGSNVVNRLGVRGNARAIGLAAYTFFFAFGLLIATVAGRISLGVLLLGVLLMPPLVLAFCGSNRRGRVRNAPPLIVLLLTYALVRAWVLPLALLRGVRQMLQGQSACT